jgi:hypothetical protein
MWATIGGIGDLQSANYRNDMEYRKTVDLFCSYIEVVRTYTKRKFSYPSDVLIAFAGVLKVLGELGLGPCVSGLPESMLDHALLWEPMKRPVCRSSNVLKVESSNRTNIPKLVLGRMARSSIPPQVQSQYSG